MINYLITNNSGFLLFNLNIKFVFMLLFEGLLFDPLPF